MPDVDISFAEESTAPLFLSIPRAASRIGVSSPKARGMAREGLLPVVQVGQRQMVVASLLTPEWFMRGSTQEGGQKGIATNYTISFRAPRA